MKILFMQILLLTLIGCTSYYPEVIDTENTATIKFKHNTDAFLGSTTSFTKIDEDLVCNSSGGFSGQQQLAFLAKGNPLARSKNENGIKVLVEDNFRVLVRNSPAGSLNRCDVILSFNVDSQKIYTINYLRTGRSCSATVDDVTNGSDSAVKVDLLESDSC